MSEILEEQVEKWFAADGALSRCMPAFFVRSGQLAMARAVARTLSEACGELIVEAGTGTGKTLAYLVPALSSGKRVMISTASKNLQAQLLEKDIPALLACMPEASADVMALKGRENYVCAQRLALAETQAYLLPRVQRHQLAQIRAWLAAGGSGDRAECDAVAEDSPIWGQVCARSAFCQAASCEAEGECRFPALRRRAQQARLIVVNHHLLSADLALREKGAAGILPKCDAYIVDEAHHLPQVLQQFMGEQASMSAIGQWAKGLAPIVEAEAGDMEALIRGLQRLPDRLAQFHAALPRQPVCLRDRLPEHVDAAWKNVRQALDALHEALTEAAPRATILAAAQQELAEWRAMLTRWWEEASDDRVAWLAWHEQGARFLTAPLEVGEAFASARARVGGSWTFTSATLNAAEDFAFFRRQLGLPNARTLKVDSPFDYARQGLIYHPVGLPDPRHPDYVRQCMRRMWPLLKASEGRALLLFSSHQAMNAAAELIRPHWPGLVLVQGERGKPALLRAFRTGEKPVLLATASFWEGVDLPGDQLRLVMIDKIPFAPPDDPVLQAQTQRLQAEKLSAFASIQVPRAALALKQGAGRLIRSERDRGVLALCDPRLTTRSYGQALRDELPPFRWTRDGAEACRFLSALAGGHLESE